MVAEMSTDEGRTLVHLLGGMKSWSSYIEPIKVCDLPMVGSYINSFV